MAVWNERSRQYKLLSLGYFTCSATLLIIYACIVFKDKAEFSHASMVNALCLTNFLYIYICIHLKNRYINNECTKLN